VEDEADVEADETAGDAPFDAGGATATGEGAGVDIEGRAPSSIGTERAGGVITVVALTTFLRGIGVGDSESTVSVMVWLWRSQCPFAYGEISPYE
jgi:hypothetical protein